MYLAKATTFFLIVVLRSVNLVFPCKINAELYKQYSDVERMLLSQNVIYGKDLNHHEENTTAPGFPFSSSAWARVSVYAVLKKEGKIAIPSRIDIRRITPRNDCSGTKNITSGKEYLFMIRFAGTNDSHVFDLDEVNPLQSAAVEATDNILHDAVKTCGLNNVRPPDGFEPPVDPELQTKKMQSLASIAASNGTCKIVEIVKPALPMEPPTTETPIVSPGNGASDVSPGNGASDVSTQQSMDNFLLQTALTVLNILTVAIFSLLL